MILRSLPFSAVLSLTASAKQNASPIIPGPPPDEYVDVTGDGRADLLITSRTVHISDPQQPGFNGLYKVGVRTLSGTAVLMWNTPSNQRWYTLEDSSRLDTALLAARIHYKQLNWTDEDQPTEFWVLERPFGPAITTDQDGWYGTGDHYDGHTMVLRSANERGTGIAAFAFELPYPYGRIAVNVKHAVRVPNGYGEEGDPIALKREPREPPFDFGHDPVEPRSIIPPGIPPDERVNLNGDEVDDLSIIGQVEPMNGIGGPGHFVRGLSPLPGTMLLMTTERWGVKRFFRLREGEVLTPEHLANGLQAGTLQWVPADRERVFVPLIRHPFGQPDEWPGWSFDPDAFDGALVYRTMEYDRPIIGTLEVVSEGNEGQFGVRPQTWVEEGQVLDVR